MKIMEEASFMRSFFFLKQKRTIKKHICLGETLLKVWTFLTIVRIEKFTGRPSYDALFYCANSF